MAARIDLAALQRQLDGFQAKFRQWAQRAVAGAEALRDGHLARLREFQATIRGLEQQHAELEQRAADVRERLARETGEVEELQAELAKIQAEQDALPALVKEVQDALEAEAAAFQRQEAALSNQESLKERKLGALHQALAMYRSRLGLEFVHGEGEQLRCIFTQLDPRDHARPFQFAVQVVGDNSYAVQACEPAVPGLQRLLEQLNGGGSFSAFVRCMRSEFQAALALLLLALAGSAVGSRVWVYTLVNTDYDGSKMLPHFLNYYHRHGVTWRRFLVLLHHTPGKYSRRGLEDAMGVCSGYSIECRVWEGTYSSEEAMAQQLGMLRDYIVDPSDWVVAADVDEFHDWGAGQGRFIKDAIAEIAESSNPMYSYIRGRLVDRVARDGRLAAVQQPMGDSQANVQSIFKQFPLACNVTNKLYRGWDTKIVAYRAHFRASRGAQHIISPDLARAYYGPCAAPPAPCARPRAFNLDTDLFNVTPYYRFKANYLYKDSPHEKRPPGLGLWAVLEAPTVIPVHHFKWHAGLLPNMRDRMEWYSGDCRLGVNEATCTPRLQHWKNAALTYAALEGGQPLDLSGMECALPKPDIDINTTTAGLAWEWMEDWLKVQEGKSGGQMPKQYRLGQFKGGG
ncbi:hypothetical protein COHA_003310 [Chlorella ohadii]|uniref:Chromosome segregation protein Spc25 C-terminal domain-containing protein n=1 Tax=Chlorella ohadii TaxID=2649997 RepID=A0AAD5H3P4_9CHLO|nr:hypothetical protein COHA_003310 [Chlorella ohadii]